MRCHSNRFHAAFTLIELLVVIAILGILAALVTAGAQRAGGKRKIAMVQGALANLESVIERYKNDLGFYPPNAVKAGNQIKAETPPLYYELTGTKYNGTQYTALDTGEPISDSAISDVFGLDGFANSNPETAKNYFSNLKDQHYDTAQGGLRVLIVPVDGPNNPLVENANGKPINTWRYVSTNPTNNTGSFDLWADIVVGSNTNRIGNWKE